MSIQKRYEVVQAINDSKPVTPVALGTHGVFLTQVGSNFQLSIFNREIPIWCLPSTSWEDFEVVAAGVRQHDGQYCLMRVPDPLPAGFHWGILPRQQDRPLPPILKGAPYAHREL